MNIFEFRKKHPDYNDLDDAELTTALHQKFYSDLPFDEFSAKFTGQGATGGWGAEKLGEKGGFKQGFSSPPTEGWKREALPIIGDIAMTMMPGPFGKIKPIKTAAKLGLGAAKGLFKMGQSAVGSGSGEYAAQQLYGEETDFGKMKEQALWGATGEGTARLAAPVFKPIFKWASDLTLSGVSIKGAVRKKQERLRKQLIADTAKKAEGFIKDVAPDVVKRAGAAIDIDDLGISVSKAFDEQKVIYDAYGKHIDAMAKGPEGGVILDDVQQLLGELPGLEPGKDIKSVINRVYGFGKESQQMAILVDAIENEIMPTKDVKNILVNLFKKGRKSDWGNLSTRQQAARDKLKATVLTDIAKESPEAVILKNAGDKAWKEIIRFNAIQKIYNSALRDMPSGDKYLNPTKLWKKIYQSEKTIMENMPELWPKLKAEADYYKEVAHNWRPPEAVQSAAERAKPLLQSLGRGATPSAAAAIALGPEWMLVYEGFGMLSAWMTLKPGARKMLGEIVRNAAVKPAAHIGGPMALPTFGEAQF